MKRRCPWPGAVMRWAFDKRCRGCSDVHRTVPPCVRPSLGVRPNILWLSTFHLTPFHTVWRAANFCVPLSMFHPAGGSSYSRAQLDSFTRLDASASRACCLQSPPGRAATRNTVVVNPEPAAERISFLCSCAGPRGALCKDASSLFGAWSVVPVVASLTSGVRGQLLGVIRNVQLPHFFFMICVFRSGEKQSFSISQASMDVDE